MMLKQSLNLEETKVSNEKTPNSYISNTALVSVDGKTRGNTF